MEKNQYADLYEKETDYWWFKGRREIVFSLLERYWNKKPLEILDAGCGTGMMMTFLEKYGTVSGVDYSSEALSFCKKRGLKNLKQGDLAKLPFKDNTFDLVTCFGVLYHKDVDDKKAFAEFTRVLKPDGRLLLTTPAMNFLRHKRFRTGHDELQHTGKRHSTFAIRKLCEENNLEIEKLSYYNMLLFPLLVSFRLFSKKQSQSDLQELPQVINSTLKRILAFEKHMIPRIPLPFGIGLICLTKPKS